ncbi:MAG: PQQ-dependent sugar dehydrogenase [Thermoproteota archaeon]|nr:PQQ-dependent sugar dehydrogenase [Thermoproteota archaeon]MDQ3888680.1 PQQ-dependent sugar dehydrogenase [Thermoproteota archaeon]
MERKRTIIIFFLAAALLVTGQSIAFSFWEVPEDNGRLVEKPSLSGDGNNNVIPAQLSSGNSNNTFQSLPDPTPPTLSDPNIRVERVMTGLEMPTSMAFLDNDDILITQKDNGRVRLVSNGILQPQPILQVPVVNNSERGLLGVAIANTTTTSTTKTVFLYYTEPVGEQVKNRLYRYEWNGTGNLTGGQLILDLPGEPGPNHDGGKLAIGPDRMLYTVIGDLNRDGMLQNVVDGPLPDSTSVILRVDYDGNGVGNPLSGGGADLSKYYAYGIRNSFGFDFDPLTGLLWDAEDGPAEFDEINIVLPGFNSGWNRVMGPIGREGITPQDLVQFQGSNYADPVFSWLRSEGVTDLEIFNSSSLGDRYTYNMFVGDINNGNLYFFTINGNRTGLDLGGIAGLEDLVADNNEELDAVIFGREFSGGITDIETGPDGYLYILTLAGDLYRLVPGAPPASAIS